MRMAWKYELRDRDKDLPEDEYYVEDQNGKIVRGYITDIYNDEYGNGKYILRNGKGRINSGFDRYGGFRMYHLYDNKEDCRDHAHYGFDLWEEALKESITGD